jgi:hypothetical protein
MLDEKNAPASADIKAAITDDLRSAREAVNASEWGRWMEEQRFVRDWMRANDVDIQ